MNDALLRHRRCGLDFTGSELDARTRNTDGPSSKSLSHFHWSLFNAIYGAHCILAGYRPSYMLCSSEYVLLSISALQVAHKLLLSRPFLCVAATFPCIPFRFLVVRVEQWVRCVCVCDCCARIIVTSDYRYLAYWLILTISRSQVKIQRHGKKTRVQLQQLLGRLNVAEKQTRIGNCK